MAPGLSTVHTVELLANVAAAASANFRAYTGGLYALSFLIVLSLAGEVKPVAYVTPAM
jgi:hypothetical protein